MTSLHTNQADKKNHRHYMHAGMPVRPTRAIGYLIGQERSDGGYSPSSQDTQQAFQKSKALGFTVGRRFMA